MASTKISALTDGVTANATDAIPAARAGANVYVTPGYIRTYLLGLANTWTATQTIAQGTITDPALNLSGTVTWNDAADTFTGWKLNVTDTASASGSLLLDLQVGSGTRFKVAKDGSVQIGTAGNGQFPGFEIQGSDRRFGMAPRSGSICGIYGNSGGDDVLTLATESSFSTRATLSVPALNVLRASASFLWQTLVSPKTANYPVVTNDSGTLFTNEGTTAKRNNTLPTAVANLGPYTFVVQDTDGLTVTAAAGDTIRIGASVSAAAGNIDSTVVGSSVTLVAINATEWIATSSIGTWVVT